MRRSPILALAAVTAGYSVLLPTQLQRAERAAATSPAVVSTYYHEPGDRPREYLEVVVSRSASEDEIEDLWCRILAPYGVDEYSTLVYFEGIDPDAGPVTLPTCA